MQWEAFEHNFPIRLNTQQKQAVQSVEGPVLLLAVPGSGKTTVLVTRLGYMIYCMGIEPESILTVTYTVAATRDMARRFADCFGEEMAQRLTFRTINGICDRIIRYCAKSVGRTPFELIMDERVTAELLSSIYRQVQQEYPTESDLKNVRTLITYIKNSMLTGEQISRLDEEAGFAVSEIYGEYRRQLRERRLMDYDDQLVYAYQMLQSFPELLAHFQDTYRYLCVDEAQDTSRLQHAILELLASKTHNLFMVGDEDQSIYGFRAAYPEALLNFEKQHAGAKILLMEENFRSDANIVRAADSFIQKNTLRHAKHMQATKQEAAQIKEVALKSRRGQYTYLAKAAENCTTETAVLYRDNECAIPLIDLLERNGTPYRMRSAEFTFFSHRIVLDMANIVRLAADPADTEAFLQIYYKIGTYIRKDDAVRIARISREQELPVLDAAICFGGLNAYTISSVKAIRTHLQNMLDEPGDRAVNRIVQFMGYGEYLERSGMSDSKIEILKAVGSREQSPLRLMERLEELRELIRTKEPSYDCPFILSTIHASKGLEYDSVYLMDIVDGILPEQAPKKSGKLSVEERKKYEEERRLFYVGVTRAKKQLTLFTMNKPSKFCDELLGKEARHTRRGGLPAEKSRTAVPLYFSGNKQTAKEEYAGHALRLRIGQTVVHKKFGEGVVVGMDKDNVRIRFGTTVRVLNLQIAAANGLLKA